MAVTHPGGQLTSPVTDGVPVACSNGTDRRLGRWSVRLWVVRALAVDGRYWKLATYIGGRAYLRDVKARTGESLSSTAFMIACLGRAVDEHKYVHALPEGSSAPHPVR